MPDKIVERSGQRSYLEYTEDTSKNRPGGLKGRKIKPKIVIHHENLENPVRCFVRLFKKYQSLCPSEAPDDAFYLTPLQKPKENCWFKNVPIGRNKLSKAISNMCKEYGIQGYKTNQHSLLPSLGARSPWKKCISFLLQYCNHKGENKYFSYIRMR